MHHPVNEQKAVEKVLVSVDNDTHKQSWEGKPDSLRDSRVG